MPPISSGYHVQGAGWFLIMTKAQVKERRGKLPKYILDLSEEWECGCMEKIITDCVTGKIDITEMYCRIISFLMTEINGMDEMLAERN